MQIDVVTLSRETLNDLNIAYLTPGERSAWLAKLEETPNAEPLVLAVKMPLSTARDSSDATEIVGILLGYRQGDEFSCVRLCIEDSEFQEMAAYALLKNLLACIAKNQDGTLILSMYGVSQRVIKVFESLGFWRSGRGQQEFTGRSLYELLRVFSVCR